MRLALVLCLSVTAWADLTYAVYRGGPNTVFCGKGHAWAQFTFLKPVAEPTNTHIWYQGVTGLPSGVTAEFKCGYAQPNCWWDATRKMYRFWSIGSATDYITFTLRFAAAMDATPGDYQLTATWLAGTPETAHVQVFTLKVRTLPADLAPVFKQRIPDPDRSDWLTAISGTLASNSCPAHGWQGGYGNEAEEWYYDGYVGFTRLAEWTGNTAWNTCAQRIIDWWASCVTKNQCNGSAWRHFSKGLTMAYQATGDPKYKDAVAFLTENGTYIWSSVQGTSVCGGFGVTTSGSTAPYPEYSCGDPNAPNCNLPLIRENARILMLYVNAAKLGISPARSQCWDGSALIEGMTDRVLFSIDQEWNGWGGVKQQHQTFMDGIALEALIAAYEYQKDPRIPYYVKLAIDGMWATRDASNCIIYDPDPYWPDSITCSTQLGGACGKRSAKMDLIIPAFMWYWNVSGDTTYRDRADTLFASRNLGCDGTTWNPVTTKQLIQVLSGMADFWTWRNGRTQSTTFSGTLSGVTIH